jgi:hypothetical protein
MTHMINLIMVVKNLVGMDKKISSGMAKNP